MFETLRYTKDTSRANVGLSANKSSAVKDFVTKDFEILIIKYSTKGKYNHISFSQAEKKTYYKGWKAFLCPKSLSFRPLHFCSLHPRLLDRQ